jgi:hypothetical protein
MGSFCARKGMPRIQVRLALCSSPTIAGVIVELSGVVVWAASTAVKAQHEGRRTVLATNVDGKRKRPARKHSNQVSNALCTAVKQRAQKLNLPGVDLSTQPAPLGHIPWFVQKPPLPAHV